MIQDLLVLQDRNATVYQLTTEINRLPAEIEKLELKIKEEQKTVEVAQQGVRDLELARKNVELEVETAEEQINKYKNQQLQVKKNDEYRALTHEIELFETKISDLETAELEIMEAIDAARSKLEEVKAEVAKTDRLPAKPDRRMSGKTGEFEVPPGRCGDCLSQSVRKNGSRSSEFV